MVISKRRTGDGIHPGILTNEGSVIEGVENCPIAIVKFDMLAFYIQQYENNSGNVYSLDDIEKMKEKIDNHRIK